MKSDLRRSLAVLAVAIALGVGVVIGTLISNGARPARSATPAADPRPLATPSPMDLSNSFSRIADQIEPAVVNITTETTVHLSAHGMGSEGQVPDNDFFNHFFHFGHPGQSPDHFQRRSLGSGVILDPRGYILTNYHVVMRTSVDKPVDRIDVFLQGDEGTKYPARIVGTDKWTDLAVIKIDAGRKLAAAQFGNSSSMKVGDWVLAVGSPFGLNSTVTAGIISAKGRGFPGVDNQFKRFIQTDAAINPGNSGGPLVNMAGQVIGINTAIATDQGSNDGIGFAIPSNTARAIYNSLITTGRVRRGAIGITFLDQTNPALLRAFGADHGVVVNNVEPGTPAQRAGLKMGDVILSINGQSINSGDELVQVVSQSKIGSKLKVDYLRNGKQHTTWVEVADRNSIVAQHEASVAPNSNNSNPGQTQGALGVSVRNLTSDQASQLVKALHLPKPQGVLVTQVVPEGFAAELTVQSGDIILSVNHQPVSSVSDFERIQGTLQTGQDVLLLIARHTGKTFTTMFLADTLP